MKGIEGAQVIQAKGQIEGSCSDRFAAVREAFAYNLGSGQDIGASVAIVVDGELVVDLWGGYVDTTYTRPWLGTRSPRGSRRPRPSRHSVRSCSPIEERSNSTHRWHGTGRSLQPKARGTSPSDRFSGTRPPCAVGTCR